MDEFEKSLFKSLKKLKSKIERENGFLTLSYLGAILAVKEVLYAYRDYKESLDD